MKRKNSKEEFGMARVFKIDENVISEISNSLQDPYNKLNEINENLRKFSILKELGLDNGILDNTIKKTNNISDNIVNIDNRLKNRVEEAGNIDSVMASKLMTFRESMEKN